MKILILSALIILTSCKLKVDKNSVATYSFIVGGNCHLVEVAQDAVCVEYQLGSFTNSEMDTDCDSQNTYYSAHNINTHFSSHVPTVDCRSGGKVGSCLKSSRRIYYYDNEWTTAAAESDCTSLSGNYTDL
jgi:hypothetical protein